MAQRQIPELAVVAAVAFLDFCVFQHSCLIDVIFVQCQLRRVATKLTGQISELQKHKTLSLRQLWGQDVMDHYLS